MRGGIKGNCNKCGNLTNIYSLDSEILCPRCLFKMIDKKISKPKQGTTDEDLLELWKNFKKVISPLIKRYA